MRGWVLGWLLTLAWMSPAVCQAQEGTDRLSWEDFADWLLSEGGDEEGTADEDLLEQLHELHCNPLDINTCKKEDLEILPFLSETQIEDLMRYAEKHRPVQSLGELMFISSLRKETRERLRLFLTVNEQTAQADKKENISIKRLLQYGKNEAVWQSDIPLYWRMGYAEYPAERLEKSPNLIYRGDPLKHAFRYSYSSMNHLLAGLNMEKDAGERGVDYWSGYVMLKNVGIVKSAIVGNYRLNFGKGLAVNTSGQYGKMMMYNAMDRMDVGISKHSSNREYGYFTGGAATIRRGAMEVSAFVSHRKADGTYNSDSMGISSLKTDGLHRTQLERSKKGNMHITDFGGNLHWENDRLQLSATAIATHLSVPLAPKHNTSSSLYRNFNAHGQDFIVGSFAYTYRYQSLTFSGETAYSQCENQSGMATLNALRWKANSHNTFTLIGRYYGAKFVSLNGKAFGENASVQNEEGIFLSWTSRALRHTTIEAYADAMYFPWLKYQVSNRSCGYEGMAQATYSPSAKWSLTARYRIKLKQQDFSYTSKGKDHTTLLYKTSQTMKIQFHYTLNNSLSFRTSATGQFVHFGNTSDKIGVAIGENIRWQNTRTKLRIDWGITYFNTDNYDARIYNYEPSLLYSFATTSYYYHGIRTTLLASIPLWQQSLFLNAKFGTTKYFNRDTIGTGLDLIQANHKEDLQIQLRWKF